MSVVISRTSFHRENARLHQGSLTHLLSVAFGSLLGHLLDPLLILSALDNPVHKDPREVNFVWLHRSRWHYLLHLGDANLASLGAVGVKVAGRAAELKVAAFVTTPSLDD